MGSFIQAITMLRGSLKFLVIAACALIAIASADSGCCETRGHTTNYQNCLTMCAASSDCALYTWYQNTCFMKSQNGITTKALEGAVSGSKDGSVVLQNTDFN